MKTLQDLATHISSKNPRSRGRYYDILGLVQRYEGRNKRAKRLTVERRCGLDDALKATHPPLANNNVLNTEKHSTRVWVINNPGDKAPIINKQGHQNQALDANSESSTS